jgi:integrase
LGAQPDGRGPGARDGSIRPWVLSLALAAAVRDGRLVRSVADGVPLPRVVGEPKRFLTHDQVPALAEACAPYGTLIKVMAYAGLRWGELVALTTPPDRPEAPAD